MHGNLTKYGRMLDHAHRLKMSKWRMKICVNLGSGNARICTLFTQRHNNLSFTSSFPVCQALEWKLWRWMQASLSLRALTTVKFVLHMKWTYWVTCVRSIVWGMQAKYKIQRHKRRHDGCKDVSGRSYCLGSFLESLSLISDPCMWLHQVTYFGWMHDYATEVLHNDVWDRHTCAYYMTFIYVCMPACDTPFSSRPLCRTVRVRPTTTTVRRPTIPHHLLGSEK